MLKRLKAIIENRKKVLGRNEWSLFYIKRNNTKSSIKVVDNKLRTKKILQKYNIPTPELLTSLSTYSKLEEFDFNSLPSSFVIKPVRGYAGGGILIVYNKDKRGNWIVDGGKKMDSDDLKSHCKSILEGNYSINNTQNIRKKKDSVLIEERIKPHKIFRYHTYKGTPDLRVIVYNKIPIMAELRLPTKKSGGKANMTIGALGVGVDISQGITTFAVQGTAGNSGRIEKVPDTNVPVSGLQIPFFDKSLEYAIKASEIVGLGFSGVDILIDRDKGPLIVELNARPGLAIQLANEDGLRRRLKKAEGIKVKTLQKGIRIAKDLFGGEIEQSIESLSGKKIIGVYENVTLFGIDDVGHRFKTKIDTGADSTSIDISIAHKIGFRDLVDKFYSIELPNNLSKEEGLELVELYKKEFIPKLNGLINIDLISSSHGFSLRPFVNITIEIDGVKFETIANIYTRKYLKYPVIIGRKSLFKFLIEPSRGS